MKHKVFLVFLVFFSLLGLFSQSEGAKDWSGEDEVKAEQGESATLRWTVTLTGPDVNEKWTYVKILHAEGPNTKAVVTFEKAGKKIVIDNQSYKNRLSDMTFDVSQSGSTVTIRFTLANLKRTMDMKGYKAALGFYNDASTYPSVTVLTIIVPIIKEGTFTLTNKPWTNEFKDPYSPSYGSMKQKVTEALKLVYEKMVSRVEIVGFMKGSVAVNFRLHFIVNITDPILRLKNAVKRNDGHLIGLTIDATSIRAGFTAPKTDGGRRITSGSPQPVDCKTWLLVIGVSVPIILLGLEKEIWLPNLQWSE